MVLWKKGSCMKCINCSYFLNCDSADENKSECENYHKRSYETKLVKVKGKNYKFERIGDVYGRD